MAIKVNGTTVINDSRALTNIASVDATTVAALGAAGVGGSVNRTLSIEMSTSGTFTSPLTGTLVITALGAGGSGAELATGAFQPSSAKYVTGGAAGGYVRKKISVTAGDSFTVTIGAGAVAAVNSTTPSNSADTGVDGTSGGTTTIVKSGAFTLTAGGGGGGRRGQSSSNNGGTASGGDVNLVGHKSLPSGAIYHGSSGALYASKGGLPKIASGSPNSSGAAFTGLGNFQNPPGLGFNQTNLVWRVNLTATGYPFSGAYAAAAIALPYAGVAAYGGSSFITGGDTYGANGNGGSGLNGGGGGCFMTLGYGNYSGNARQAGDGGNGLAIFTIFTEL